MFPRVLRCGDWNVILAGIKATRKGDPSMDEANTEKPTSLECTNTPGYSWPGANLFKSLKLSWHWRKLRWAVVAASEAAQGHEANGLPAGSREFKTLFNEVIAKVEEYSSAAGYPLEALKARLPALCALERLANPASAVPRNKVGLTLGILIAMVLGPIVCGALIGLGTGMAHWISHLIG
jgi:hypothetical protein